MSAPLSEFDVCVLIDDNSKTQMSELTLELLKLKSQNLLLKNENTTVSADLMQAKMKMRHTKKKQT